ncbi:MAG: DUF799 family lipoprotein [Candidatus Rokubacteria bacterium]|nr:DUF799 family lipoprotein [Candidatus Rokubacteria bacterium]
MSPRRALAAVLALAVAAAGCASAGGGRLLDVSAQELPRTLAVLPFVPKPEKEEQTRVLSRMIYGALSATSYDVIKPQVVDERLVRAGLADPAAVRMRPPAEIARLLGVDALLYGELTHYDRLFLGIYAQVSAGASIHLVDARSGLTLFERTEVETSREGGLPTNVVSAFITVVQAAMKLREIELIRACDDLVRDLLKGLPTPPAGEARRPPAFVALVSDGEGRLLKAGDTVSVVAQGKPGVIGSFDVVPLARNLALEEREEGVYVGRYTVKPGDNATDVYVQARLADTAGRVSEREDVLGRFSIDTAPPATPKGLRVSLDARGFVLAWELGAEPDLAGYRVYRSDSALTGFVAAATTETPRFNDAATSLGFYRVTAVDRAGNESAPSASIALPVLSSPLSGRLGRDSYLVPAQSPYVLQGALTIEEGARLYVLPGVLVRFAPGSSGIVIADGALVARGTPAAGIVFTSSSDRPRAGDFQTAVRVRARDGQVSMLEHVTV